MGQKRVNGIPEVELGKWGPTRWWAVVGPKEEVLAETSNREEALELMGPEDTLYRQYMKVEKEWRRVE